MVLTRRQLYMLPTRHGLLFTLVLLVIFLASVNYNNGLAYGLTFLLAAMALVSMLHTHRNVSGLEVKVLSCPPAFAGETVHFRVSIHNPLDYARISVWIICGEHRQVAQIPASGSTQIEIPVVSTGRGYITCPPLRLSSAYPLGLQYTWSAPVRSPAKGVVYPKPVGTGLPQQNLSPARFSESGRNADGDDFAGLREYKAGDSPRHIHWKAVASHQELLTKQFAGNGTEELWLRWSDTSGSTEARLSQLSRWVVDADRAAQRYGLSMPGKEWPPDRGSQHYHHCLRVLGLWGIDH